MIENMTSVRVRYADTDKMGVVYYTKYLEWFEVGRTELLREIGLPYSKLEESGIGLPVLEAYCKYLGAATYDEVVHIASCIQELPRVRVRVDYRLFDEQQERLLVEGYTVHCFIGKHGGAIRAPRDFVDHLARHMSGHQPTL